MKNPALLFGTCLIVVLAIGAVLKLTAPAPTPANNQQIDLETLLKQAEQNNTTASGAAENTNTKGPMKTLKDFAPITAKQATISTAKGDIVLELYPDKAPLTVTNFLTLAKSGFYNGIKFHRIIPGFMAQVGDPNTKDPAKEALWGTGGPGYVIQDEFGDGLKHDSAGILSMANAGANTGGSQFFITYEETPWLDGKHAVFGKVTSGMDVLEKLEIGDEIKTITF